MPFTFSFASHRCTAAAFSPMQARQLTTLVYLDHWIIIFWSAEQAVRAIAILLDHVNQLSLTLSNAKSNLTSSQKVSYLGMTHRQ